MTEILIKAGLDSSRLESGTYVRDEGNPLEHILTVTFKDGGCYSYYGVPPEVAQDFFAAKSPGGYLHAYIKDKFQYAKVDAEPQGDVKPPMEVAYEALGPKLKVDNLIEAAKSAADNLPNCRAKALVLTKLDEAALWLTKVS